MIRKARYGRPPGGNGAENTGIIFWGSYRRRGWELGGYNSCAHWLAARTRLSLHTAREKVRAARALEDLPLISAAMARGELSLCAVRALSRVATPENEAELLEAGRGCTVAQIERMVRAYRRRGPDDEAERERRRFQDRHFSIFPDEDGMYVVKGLLPREIASVLEKAMEAGGDALWRDDRDRAPARLLSDAERTRRAGRRRADALGLLAERALQAGFGGHASAEADAEGREEAASAAGDERDDVPVSGSRAERYQVMLHVEAGALDPDEPDGARLDDGTPVSYETSLRLSCDASLVTVVHAPGSRHRHHHAEPASPHDHPRVLNIGRRTRTIPPALRRALNVRDQGCRFPGCGLRFASAHHVIHWAHGGETSLRNYLLLCRHHHRLVHEEGWTVTWWGEGRPVFHDTRGGVHFDGRWEAPELPSAPVAHLLEDNARRGACPDGGAACAAWERECDIPFPVLARFAEVADGVVPP